MVAKQLKELGKFSLTLAVVLAVTFLFSNFIGLARTGFESAEILNLQTFYVIGGIFALGLFLLVIFSIFVTKKDEKYGNSIGFASQGEKPHLKVFGRFTGFQLFLLSLIIFLILGLANFALLPQNTYTGVGVLEKQQFTTADSIIFSSLLIPGAENLGSAFFFALVLVILGVIARKRNLKPNDHKTLVLFVAPLFIGLFGVGNHLLRYGGFEISLFIVFGFWLFGGLLTAFTGSFVPFWVLHLVNNFYFDIATSLSRENVFLLIIIFIILLIVFYFILYGKGRLLGSKKKFEI